MPRKPSVIEQINLPLPMIAQETKLTLQRKTHDIPPIPAYRMHHDALELAQKSHTNTPSSIPSSIQARRASIESLL
jgi:hypothetical protein